MSKLAALPDPVAAAVDAVEAREAPAPIAMLQKQVTISSTGRPAVVIIPMDMSVGELAELVGWMLTGLRAELAAQAPAPTSRIIVPGRPS